MARLNRFEIIGHLGADPTMKYTPNGNAVCELRVAVNNGRKQPDGSWSDDTMWVSVELWNDAAERAAEQLRKGNLVYAEGQLNVREYETRDGRFGAAVELKFARAMSLERRPRDEAGFADAPPARQAAPAQAQPRGAQRQPVAAGVDVDDIPF